MNVATHLRHYLTFLGGIGTIFLGWNLLTPDQVGAANDAGAKLIEPLVVIMGLVAVTVFRLAIAWLGKVLRLGAGEGNAKGDGGTGSGGALPAILMVCGAAGLLGVSLPSCAPVSPVTRFSLTTDFTDWHGFKEGMPPVALRVEASAK